MDVFDVMRTRAIREFRPDPIPDDVLYRVLDNARFAPSGGNRQGWRVIVVRDREMRKRVGELYRRNWLALRAEGLGTVLTAGLSTVEADARQLLGIPDDYILAAHLGVGWPARGFPRRLTRKPVEEFACFDRFEGPPLTGASAGTRPAQPSAQA